jgi:hypothetical protein
LPLPRRENQTEGVWTKSFGNPEIKRHFVLLFGHAKTTEPVSMTLDVRINRHLNLLHGYTNRRPCIFTFRFNLIEQRLIIQNCREHLVTLKKKE